LKRMSNRSFTHQVKYQKSINKISG